jgi:hypothetical protein
VPVVFGLPSYDMYKESKEGGFRLGGCVVRADGPVWSCGQGHEWVGKDRKEWSRFLAAVRKDRS